MRGVGYPVLGISNTGDSKVMYPNADYLFDGDYVYEHPLQEGGYAPNIRYESYLGDMPALPDYSSLALIQNARANLDRNPSKYNKVAAVETAAPYI